jgi:hypothetical protein
MFAGVEIVSYLFEPAFWDTFLYGALAVASAWLVGTFGPIIAWQFSSGGVKTLRVALSPDEVCKDATVVERISAALAAPGEGSEAARDTGGPPDGKGAGGRREGARWKGRPKRVWLLTGDEEPFLCWVTDRGRGGLGIVVTRLVPIGTAIMVRPADAPANVPWVRLEVRSCRRKGPRWHIGCQYTEELPSMLRLQLG